MFGKTFLFTFYHPRFFWRKNYRRKLTLNMAICLCAFIFVIFSCRIFTFLPFTPIREQNNIYSFLFYNKNGARNMLTTVMPAMALTNQDRHTSKINTPAQTILSLALKPFYVDRHDLKTFFKSQIPFLAMLKTSQVTPVMANPYPDPKIEQKLPSPLSSTSKYLVAIYHTHTGENYALTDGKERLDGKRGGVVTVGAAIKEVLENKYAIKTMHVNKIHDRKYNTSYLQSEKTVRKLIATNPELVVLLDIHRDIKRDRKSKYCLVKVNGREVAPLFFVVGSDARAPFPTWQQNYELAKTLASEIEKRYPGLCVGVMVREGRYNQFLHPGILLIEIGNVNNSTAEAVASGRLFADVLAQMILNARQSQKILP